VEELSARSGIGRPRLSQILDAVAEATLEELERMAKCLAVSRRELVADAFAGAARVVIQRPAEVAPFDFPSRDRRAYSVRSLAQSPIAPQARPVELMTTDDARSASDSELRFGLHQYAYVLGPHSVRCIWEGGGQRREVVLAPGDSLYMKPWTPHSFRSLDGHGQGRVLSFRCAGATGAEAMAELSMVGLEAARQLVAHQAVWYD